MDGLLPVALSTVCCPVRGLLYSAQFWYYASLLYCAKPVELGKVCCTLKRFCIVQNMLSCVNHVVLYKFCCTLEYLLYLEKPLDSAEPVVPSKSYSAKPVIMVAVGMVKA